MNMNQGSDELHQSGNSGNIETFSIFSGYGAKIPTFNLKPKLEKTMYAHI